MQDGVLERKRVLTVFGTRPEAIKLAPIIKALDARQDLFEPVVAVTAQHREMLDQVLELFALTPDYDLDIMTDGQTLTDITLRGLSGLDALMTRSRPDTVIVQGDTTSTFVAALAAFYHRVPVAHVEAGLRTHDISRPYPEEGNRQLTSRTSHWHFAPTPLARGHLLSEGIDSATIHVTGNAVVDALLQVREQPHSFDAGPIADALDSGRRIVLVTAHRRENWGAPIERVCAAITELVSRFDDISVLFVTHKNPVLANAIDRCLSSTERIDLIPPQEYLPFVKLMDAATLILSDSGGIQEEAPALGRPALVLRDITERPEAVDAGVVKLVGTDTDRIVAKATQLLADRPSYEAMARATSPYADGTAARRIVDILARELRPADAAQCEN